MNTEQILDNIAQIKNSLPPGIKLEAAAKTRSAEEVKAAIDGGVDFIGYNYVQEGVDIYSALNTLYGKEFADSLRFSLIGNLQKNKINKALSLFTMVETVESSEKARHIDKRAQKPVDVLIQVNIGGEDSKAGAPPSDIMTIADTIEELPSLNLCGLMTIEPYMDDPESSRDYFQRTKALFDQVREKYGSTITDLSMGMSHNYHVALEEGATIVRIGTGIFGPRNYNT